MGGVGLSSGEAETTFENKESRGFVNGSLATGCNGHVGVEHLTGLGC